jgi:altronate hydrolase
MLDTDSAPGSAPRALRLDRRDNVLVAVTDLPRGTSVEGIPLADDVPAGHKVASALVRAGEPVRKFG